MVEGDCDHTQASHLKITCNIKGPRYGVN